MIPAVNYINCSTYVWQSVMQKYRISSLHLDLIGWPYLDTHMTGKGWRFKPGVAILSLRHLSKLSYLQNHLKRVAKKACSMLRLVTHWENTVHFCHVFVKLFLCIKLAFNGNYTTRTWTSPKNSSCSITTTMSSSACITRETLPVDY